MSYRNIKIPNVEIESTLKEIDNLPNKKRKELYEIVDGICYDRMACSRRGINYNNISNKDWIILLVKEYNRIKSDNRIRFKAATK